MPEQNEIYDPDTKTWYRITDTAEDQAPGWTVVTDKAEPESNEPDDPNTESVSTSTPCDQLGKRHKYKDRQTGTIYDYCLNCGQARPAPGQSTQRAPSSGSGGGKTVTPLDTLFSGAWMALGMVVRNAVPEPAGPAAGKMIQLEAGIAGPKLHKAIKKTPLYPYLAIASNQLSWVADISMLVVPPILIGLAAARPKLAKQFKPVLVTALVPVLAEAAKQAERQRKLIENLEGYSQETISMADQLIDSLINPDDDDESEAS